MSFPASFLDELRNRLPLSELVGARLRLVRAGREYKGCCPFHNEKTPSFYINNEKQFYHCFGCGAHGDVIGFMMHYEHLSFPEAIENLAAQAGMEVPKNSPEEKQKFDKEKRLLHLLEKTTAWFEEQLFLPIGKEGLAYLRARGLSDEAIRRFRLGYAPTEGQALIRKMTAEGFTLEDMLSVGLVKNSEERRESFSFFRNRVMFPVGDVRGRTVAFGARILGEGEPKYLNSPEHVFFHKGRLLYGLSRARTALSQGQPIIVVEGYMDVIALVEAGYSGAVAPLGTALTEEQVQVLWKLLPPIENRDPSRDYSPILCFDGDSAGIRAASRAVERALPHLTSAKTLRIATITGAKDPDELIRKEGRSAFDAILKQALPMIDVLWSQSLGGRTMSTPEDRSMFKAVFKKRILQIKEESLQKLYSEEFNRRFDAAFGWTPQPSRAAQRRPWNKNTSQDSYTKARQKPRDKRRATEMMLLALIINHPDLFDEVGEEFAFFDMQTVEFAALREKVIDVLSQDHESEPTTEELLRALNMSAENPFAYEEGRGVLDEVLGPMTYMGVGRAARPEATQAEARKAWRAIWESLEQEKIRGEYAAIHARYIENGNEEDKKRMEALHEKIVGYSSAS